jgi:hypothetical protein
VHLHPLAPSVKCQHCGADLSVRTRVGRDLYRCTADTPCRGYMLHYRRDGKSCGIAPEHNYGVIGTWVQCADRGPAKGA